MIFETERLILRPWDEADAEECYKYAQDPRVGPAAGWPVHTSVEESRRVIREILSVSEVYAIVLKETGLPVGSIGLHFHSDLAEADDEAELGYWLGVPYWGRGLVPEAGREMLRHAFEDLGLARVWCGYFDGNDKSRRVQEKLGFRHQRTSDNVPVPQLGETRKGHVNLLTRAEWLAGAGRVPETNAAHGVIRTELMPDRIETERLVLFPYTKDNLALFNSDLPRFEETYGVVYRGEELDYLLTGFLKKLELEIAADPDNYLFFTEFLIALKENGHVIGSIDYKYVPLDGVTEVGYGLNPAYEGHGYMTEALRAFLAFGKAAGIRIVRADTRKDNEKSQNVLKKCGFRFLREDGNLWWENVLAAEPDNETEVRLSEVTEDNWLTTAALSVKEDQKAFVAPAVGILARGYVYRDCNARVFVIEAGREIVGLALVREFTDEPLGYDLQQFMIGAGYQGRGYGTRALGLILDELRREAHYDHVEVCVKKADAAAIRLYEKYGFADSGYVDEEAPDALNMICRLT